jgi:uncharacterized protein YjdB
MTTQHASPERRIPRMKRTTFRLLALAALAAAGACNDRANRPTPVASTLEIVGGTDQEAAAGSPLGQQLVVRVRDQNDRPLDRVPVTWEVVSGGGSVGAAAAATDADGHARTSLTLGTAAGENRVRASFAGLPPVVFVARGLAGAPASVAVTPDSARAVALGDTVRFSAAVADAHGNPIHSAGLAWTSSDEAVASVDASGLVRATGSGATQIRARAGDAQGEARFVVVQMPATVEVAPGAVELDEGGTHTLVAAIRDANGHTVADSVARWSSSNEAVAAVDADGRVSGISSGTATIVARSGDAFGQAIVTVVALPVATAIELVAGSGQLGVAGAALAQHLVARVRDQHGQPMPQVEVAWQAVGGGSLSTATAVTDADGLVRSTWTLGTTAGANEARAAVAGVADVVFTAVGVPGAPASVSITPAVATLTAVQDTVRFGAVVADQHGNVIASPSIGWTSDAEAVATVSAQGLATARAGGTARIQATAGDASASATLLVSQVPTSVVVTPAALELDEGATAQLTAEVRDRNGVAIPDSVPRWSSSDEAVVSVDASGRVTGVGPDTATVVARSGAVQGQASVTVRSVAVDCSVVRTFGAGETLSGALPSVNITGPVTLSADAHACGSVLVRGAGARLRLNGHRLQVDGDLRVDFGTGSSGVGWAMVVMTQPSDRLAVGGNVIWDSAASRDSISAGVLSVAGSFGTGTGSRSGFVATGTHRTVLNGASSQAVNFTFTLPDEHTFRHLEIANPAGVSFGEVRVSGDLTYATQSQLSVSGTLDIGGVLTVPAGSRISGNRLRLRSGSDGVQGEYDVVTTEFYGPNPVIKPSLSYRNVRINGGGVALLLGDTRMSGGLDVSPAVAGDTTATFRLAGHTLRVDGNLDMYAVRLVMKDPADRLIVGGHAVLNLGTSQDSISAGELHVAGNFMTGTWRRQGFSPTGTHRTVLNGTTPQTVSLTFASPTEHRFRHLVVANPAGVNFANPDLPVMGNLELTGRANVAAGRRITVADTLILRASSVLDNQGTVTAAACNRENGSTVLGQDPCPCALPALPPGFSAQGVTRAQLPVAVDDAASRMTPALGESELATAMAGALTQLRTTLQGSDAAATCGAFNLAAQRFAAWPDDASTRPDRAAIGHVLDLTNAVLRSAP